MKVVVAVLHHLVFGGPHNQLLRLHKPLRDRGWETVVVLPEGQGDGVDRLSSAGLRVIQTPIHRPRKTLHPGPHLGLVFGLWPEISRLRRVIREEGANVVQVFGPMYPHGAIAARMEHVPVVWQLLGTFAPPLIRTLLMPVVLNLSTVIMTTGMEVARAHPGATRRGERLVTFFPPVDTYEFRPDRLRREQARHELGIPGNGFLIGTVGNFNWVKGHDVFVRAAASVLERFPRAYFRILGAETPSQAARYEKDVKQLAANLHLLDRDRLRFIKPGNRVAKLLPAFDLFVLTSRAEGVPTAVLEAMACGIPVVSVRVGSVHEAVVEGETGHLVERPDSEVVASKILETLANLSNLNRIGMNARTVATERFDSARCRDAHVRAYRMAMGELATTESLPSSVNNSRVQTKDGEGGIQLNNGHELIVGTNGNSATRSNAGKGL